MARSKSLKPGGGKLSRKARRAAGKALPNPVANLVLADIALRGGGALLRRAVEKNLLAQKVGKDRAEQKVKARSLGESLVATALARVATRSVPGAIVVGGGMLAKTLYDRRKAKRQAVKDEATED